MKKVNAVPGHSITLGALGCFILWFGWYGFNGAAAWDGNSLASIFVTTTIAPAVATCVTMIFTWVKNGKPECMKEFRSFCNQKAKEGLQEFREYYKRSYIFGAVDSFDEYMIAVEWYRPLEKKFWLPRRNILLPVANAMQRLVEGELDLLAVSLPPGTGKTTLKNFLLTWVAGKYPDKPNLDSGHSASMTRSTYDGCLQIMKDPEYLWSTIFPGNKVITDAHELRIDVDKKHRFSTIT